jgi:regulator of sigma E protease
MIFLAVILFIVIFSSLIFIHELGHFVAAKRAGVKVEEFGFGLPPRIWGKKKGETIYSINLIPFGGFVRMLGEDSGDPDSAKNKRSLVNQSVWVQTKIVCAGVFMNLLLSFVLLTFGFMIGIEPLIANQDDFYGAIADGYVDLEPGIVVVESNEPYNTVVYNGEELDIRSFEPGDRILTDAEGEPILSIEEWDAMLIEIRETGEAPLLQMDRADGTGGAEYLTKEKLDQITLAPIYIQRFFYKENANSIFNGVLQNGDVLLKINGAQIIEEESLLEMLKYTKQVHLEFFRPSEGILETDLDLNPVHPIISYVEGGSPAALAGLLAGDQIFSINGEEILSAPSVIIATQKADGTQIDYQILRDGETLSFSFTPREDDRIGVAIGDILDYPELSLYESYLPHTVLDVREVSYLNPFSAAAEALSEMWRLGKLTAVMFINVLGNFVSGGDVPNGVSGPVGIAQMTYVFMQDGFAAIIRFVALLSLSLGVINILPIPALDGGRFFFILLQGITGKKADPKIEGWIHTVGFVFLLLFIAYISFHDLLRLF